MASDRVPGNPRRFKVTAVGDVDQGKPDLLGLASSGRSRTVTVTLTVDGSPFAVALTDTGGMEELDRLQPALYRDTDCFLLCYSAHNRGSLDSVESKWWPEVQSISPGVPALLVAVQEGGGGGDSEVSPSEGQHLQRKLGLASHAACQRASLEPVLAEAVRAARSRPPAPAPKAAPKSTPFLLEDSTERSSGGCSCFTACCKSKGSSYSFQ